MFQPSQAKEQSVARGILRVREFVVHVTHTTRWGGRPRLLPWTGCRGLPGSGTCNFLGVRYQTLPGFIGGGLSPEKTRIQADHHSDRDNRAWKTYATVGMGVTDHMERLGAYSWQLSRRARRARGRHGLWKTKGLSTYSSSSSGSTAHSTGEELFKYWYED